MKQLIEYYGNTIITVIVATILMGLICGLPKQLGPVIERTLETHDTTGATTAFTSYIEEALPQIVVQDAYCYEANRWYLLSDCLVAENESEDFLMVKAVSGWKTDDPQIQLQISNRGAFIYSPKPGSYWVVARVSTDSGRAREVMVKILFNEGRLI